MKIFKNRNELLSHLGKNLIIAEIGVFKGEFSKFIFENLNPKELYLVDIFQGRMGSGDKDGNNMEYVILENEYKKISDFFEGNKNVKIIKSKSLNFLNNSNDDFFDLVYIDADHEYESVYSDLNASYNKVKKGGYICGHDYVSPRFDGVVNAVNKFCNEKNLSIEFLTKDGCPSYCIIKK